MKPLEFFSASRLIIVAGKGGVGKTTVTAVVARAAARHGLRVLAVEVEEHTGLRALLDVGTRPPVSEAATTVSGTVEPLDTGLGPNGTGTLSFATITPGPALLEYLDGHGMHRISKRLSRTGVLDVVSTAAPGIEDILVLGKIKQLERSGRFDLVVVDGPAAGHAIAFLQAAAGLLDAVDVGPIQVQARDVAELLADPARCQVMLVTLAEETPVNEVIETAFALEDRVGVALTPVVVNAVYAHRDLPPSDDPVLEEAAEFRRTRLAAQAERLTRLGAELPLPQLVLPFQFTAAIGPADTDALAEALVAQLADLA